jgi:hypothetical protein
MSLRALGGTATTWGMEMRCATVKAFLLTFFTLLLVGTASAQEKLSQQQLVGTWKLVSVVNTLTDGSKFDPFGGQGIGMLMLDSGGRFSFNIIRSDIPNYASNNRLKATPEEYKATAEGLLCFFGTYQLDPTGGSVTLNIASSSFPNFRGQSTKRDLALKGDELAFISAAGAAGGTSVVTWMRTK